MRCRPRGSELRDLTDHADAVNWFTAWTGLVGLLGWLLHLTVFRRRWWVSAEPIEPSVATAVLRVDGLRKSEAEATFADLVGWVEQGKPFAAFAPTSGTSGIRRIRIRRARR